MKLIQEMLGEKFNVKGSVNCGDPKYIEAFEVRVEGKLVHSEQQGNHGWLDNHPCEEHKAAVKKACEDAVAGKPVTLPEKREDSAIQEEKAAKAAKEAEMEKKKKDAEEAKKKKQQEEEEKKLKAAEAEAKKKADAAAAKKAEAAAKKKKEADAKKAEAAKAEEGEAAKKQAKEEGAKKKQAEEDAKKAEEESKLKEEEEAKTREAAEKALAEAEAKMRAEADELAELEKRAKEKEAELEGGPQAAAPELKQSLPGPLGLFGFSCCRAAPEAEEAAGVEAPTVAVPDEKF